jgi:hypothetical protein
MKKLSLRLIKKNYESKRNYVSQDLARSVAEKIIFNNKKSSKTKSQRKVKSIFGVPEKIEKSKKSSNKVSRVYYIINYEQEGFIILAANKKARPILAYSKNNHFPIKPEFDPAGNSKFYPFGLNAWLYSMKKHIKKITKNYSKAIKKSKLETNKKLWKKLINNQSFNIPNGSQGSRSNLKNIEPPDDGCDDYTNTYGPYLETQWHQRSDFNKELSDYGCTITDNGKPLVGCVAVAMAQVMNYHEYPNDYNWDNMQDTYATTSTAILMEDIGDAVNMDYGCYASGASGEDIAPAFKSEFGYSSASYHSYDYSEVGTELATYERPVILTGSGGGAAHAWVCDGYRVYHDECTGVSFVDLYMHWGWFENDYNGWYDFDDFDPGDSVFNNNNKMVHNIIP